MNLLNKINAAFITWQKYGLSSFITHLKFQFLSLEQKFVYQKWIQENDALSNEKRKNLLQQIDEFSHKPLISIILPVYNIEEKWLRLCIESVKKQIYVNWELCVADDCSSNPQVHKVLEEYKKEDKRIKVVFRKENGHISAASNSALDLVTGEFTVLLDHDDELSEHALFYVARELNDFPETDMIYSDEDLINENGRRFAPKFKPDWSQDLFYSTNLITHLSGYRTEVLQKVGGFKVGLEGSQDYDLALRVIEEISEEKIRHIPKILYHWRVISGSVAMSGDEKPYAHDAARKAIASHLKRIGKEAKVVRTVHNLHRVCYELPKKLPRISLILATARKLESAKQASEKLNEETDYENLEVKLVSFENGNRAEKYNQIVAETSGEILCFIDVDFKPLSKVWLKELVSFALQKEIGAVGAKTLSPQNSVVGSSLLVGINNLIGIAHHHFPRERDGHITRNRIIGNFSAVSISTLATRREVFEKMDGFDEKNFPNRFFDVDYCLRLWNKKMRVVFTPYAELIQTNKKGFVKTKEAVAQLEFQKFRQKWQKYIENDPFHNPNLSKKNGHFFINR